ncbi:MAG: hypothetical protein HY288_15235 [Planctomycetia bacterium]|nr:hypothetical protein [Planctomycetia bacterium]
MRSRPKLSAHDGQPLNPLDLALRCVDRSIRDMGYPGFETQMLAWMSGRVDAAGLRRAIVQLGQCYPVITASLMESDLDDGVSPYWTFQPGREATLHEAELRTADPGEVLSCAEELLSVSHDLANEAPLRFHLLRRPDGRDVFLMQYNHVLVDNRATALLLRQLNQLFQATNHHLSPHHEPRNLVNQRLRAVPHADRRAAALRAIELQGRTLRGRAAILGTDQRDSSPVKLRIDARCIASEETRAIHARVLKLCGLPSLSMAILASTFRAIHHLGCDRRNAGRNYVAGIGLDLNLRGGGQLLLQNLLSVVPISAREEDLNDRDRLVRVLTGQLRNHLESSVDLGVLRLAAAFHRRPRHMSWVIEHLLRCGCSLWYAYFGSLDMVGPRLFGAEIEKIFYVGPTWSPMGISLLVNQFHGRLFFQATYDPVLVTQPLAEAFLDHILTDLQHGNVP